MKQRILVVIDVQNDFVYGSLGSEEAKAIVPKVIDKIENFKGTVVYTRDTHEADYLDTMEGKNLPIIHGLEGTEGWQIVTEVLNAGIDKRPKNGLLWIYNKSTFGCIGLARDLRDLLLSGIDVEIELIGLEIDMCVVSNVLLFKAFLPEVPIRVDSSCCAGVTKETSEAAIKVMKMCHIEVI